MEPDKVFGLITLGWLIGAVLLMARMIRRGRELAKLLATRHPESYQALGRPQPGFFHSARGRRFAQFVARREFEDLDDLLWLLLGSLLVVFLVILALRHGY
jgi:hypothetical protein